MPGQRRAYDDKQGAQAVGRVIAALMPEGEDTLIVDHFIITRSIDTKYDKFKHMNREVKRYVFEESR